MGSDNAALLNVSTGTIETVIQQLSRQTTTFGFPATSRDGPVPSGHLLLAEGHLLPAEGHPLSEEYPAVDVIVDAVEENYCLDCHADKEQLIDTADPVVEAVSENEGAG